MEGIYGIMGSLVKLLEFPEIILPFPGRMAPNKFLIYRYGIISTEYSSFHESYIAKRWKSEPKHVQKEYSILATEVDNLFKQRFDTDSRKKSRTCK